MVDRHGDRSRKLRAHVLTANSRGREKERERREERAFTLGMALTLQPTLIYFLL